MKRKTGFLLIACCILAVQIPELYAQKNPSPEQLIAEHLKSIGDPAALSAVTSITLTGNATVNFVIGMTGFQNQRGASTLVSEGAKMSIIMSFPDTNNYAGEHFAYNGKSVTVGNFTVGERSPIADFLRRYDKIMKNGMLGGVLSNAWPLLDVKSNRPRNMRVSKTKLAGMELYSLEYRPRDDHGDMKILMYFDPQTYRHILTEYRVQTQGDTTMGFDPNANDGDMAISRTSSETYYTLMERFDDFRKVGDLVLPHSYMLDFSVTHHGTGNMGGFAANWGIEALKWELNTPVDQKLFNTER